MCFSFFITRDQVTDKSLFTAKDAKSAKVLLSIFFASFALFAVREVL